MSKPLKIEIVSFTGDSGLADYAVSLGRAISGAGAALVNNVKVITASSLPSRFDSMGFDVLRVFRRSRHYPVDIIKFLIGVLRRRPDWILLQGPLKFAVIDGLVIHILRLFGVRCAITVHDVLPHYPKPWSRLTFGFYYRAFDRVIAHSDAAKQGLRQLGIRGDILIVPHGIYDIFDLNQLSRTQARTLLQQDAKPIWILFFGHLELRKGILEFLDVAEAMIEKTHIKFVLAGSSSLMQQGAANAQRLEDARHWPNVLVCDERIPFEQVERYFAASDIVALPYLEGTTSGVLKLALAFGKPVVATEIGDFPEQIPSGAGILFPADNNISDHLISAINKMCDNLPTHTAAMQASRGHAEWSTIAQHILVFLKASQHA